jgi:hypothetical protein
MRMAESVRFGRACEGNSQPSLSKRVQCRLCQLRVLVAEEGLEPPTHGL